MSESTAVATESTGTPATGHAGVTIVKAEKPLKINNPNLKLDIEATPSYPQFASLQDAVNFAGSEAPVLEGLNTYVKNTVVANMRQKIRTAGEGTKPEAIVESAEKYGVEWTFSSEGSETVKKADLIERNNKALAALEASERGENVDVAAVIAMLRGAK